MGMAKIAIPIDCYSFGEFWTKEKPPLPEFYWSIKNRKGNCMNSNSFLISFGMKSEGFERIDGQIKFDEAFLSRQ